MQGKPQHEPPTKPGRYWFRCPFWTDNEWCVMKVEFVRGKLRAKGEAGKWPLVGMSGASQWWSEPIEEPPA